MSQDELLMLPTLGTLAALVAGVILIQTLWKKD